MNIKNKRLWSFVGRFFLIYIVTYFLISVLFLLIQNSLPESNKIALEFFRPYRFPSIITFIQVIFSSGIMALILYPFYNTIAKRKRGWLILFGVIWGLGILGSVKPMPGSIEGLIYTKTTLIEHFMVLIAAAIHAFLVSWFFLSREKHVNSKKEENMSKKIWGYLGKFTLLHVITYLVVGIIFFQLQDYENAFATQDQFKLYRSMNHPMVAAAIPIQILRGGFLAFFLYPFYNTFMKNENGWLLLFGLLYIFTAGIQSLPEIVSVETSIMQLITGLPEVTVQMLVFSWLFFKWERKKHNYNFN